LSQLPLSLAQQFEDSIWLQPFDVVSERGGRARILDSPVLAKAILLGRCARIWLSFAGGISAFAVILPKPMGTGGGYPEASHVNGCYAETLDRKTGSNFGSL
jgi:hypothetical protein